jgi:metallophosphoesterase (TIGR00282 family)
MRILFIGDIVGKPGRRAVRHLLPRMREAHGPDVIIANGENMAGGKGVTRETAAEMLGLGISVITTGNHIWDRPETPAFMAEDPPVLRPLNYPPGTPGRGWIEVPAKGGSLVVVNAQGRVFMRSLDDPFRATDALLSELDGHKHIFIDFHAEATAEKQAFALFLDGRVGAVVGTHTHVPTADARILPGGTAYISDVGMVGPRDSVIGDEPEPHIQRLLTHMYHRASIAGGPVSFNAVLVDLDDGTGLATSIALLQDVVS